MTRRPSILCVAHTLGWGVPCVVLTWAALGKAVALDEFARVTSALTVFPWSVRQMLPLLIPSAEVLVAYLLFIPASRGLGLLLATLLLGTFTGFLAVQWVRPFAPQCQCFGLLALASEASESVHWNVIRNLGLLMLLGVAWLTRARDVIEGDCSMTTSLGTGEPLVRRAVTIVELLVVMAVISLLLGILMPVTGRVREQARATQCGANLRSIGQAMFSHAQAYRGHGPLAGEVRLGPPVSNAAAWSLAERLGDVSRQKYAYVSASEAGMLTSSMTEQVTPMPWVLLPQMGVNVNRLQANCTTSEEYARLVEQWSPLRVFSCPDGPAAYRFASELIWYVESQGASHASWWSASIDYVPNSGVLGYARDDLSRRWLNGRVSGVRSADRLVLLADGATESSRSVLNAWLPAGTGEITMADLLPGSTPTGRVEGKPLAPSRHRNTANVLFADGHVERLSLDATSLRSAVLMTSDGP